MRKIVLAAAIAGSALGLAACSETAEQAGPRAADHQQALAQALAGARQAQHGLGLEQQREDHAYQGAGEYGRQRGHLAPQRWPVLPDAWHPERSCNRGIRANWTAARDARS